MFRSQRKKPGHLALQYSVGLAGLIEDPSLAFDFPNPSELRPPLITLDLAAVGYAEDAPILRRLNLRIDPDDRIALLGRNGNGKTTLARLLEVPWGRKAVRLSIAIGRDADRDVLARFIGNVEIPPFEANNAEALVRQVRWVSTVVLRAASSPAIAAEDAPASNVPIEIPIEFTAPSGEDDVW